MRSILSLLALLLTTCVYAQKKYNFGLSLGSEQFYSKNKGNSPIEYNLQNNQSYKIGFFVERRLKNNNEILVGFNYNYYWNYYTERFMSDETWQYGVSNTFYDLDIQYNHLLTNRFKVFVGLNISYYHFHDKYAGYGFVEDQLYYSEKNNVTDFNIALNTGIKYVINPKSKIKFEPFVLIGANAFRRDNFEIEYPIEGVSSSHFYKRIYTRFGLNIKY